MVKQAAVAPDNGPMNSAAGVQEPLLIKRNWIKSGRRTQLCPTQQEKAI